MNVRTSRGLAAAVATLWAVFFPAAAQGAFRCTDSKGVTHFGDTPPPQCSNVRIFELNSSGVVIRVIEPSLTPEQVAERERERQRAQEAARAAADARRRDSALIATYTTEQEFDLALARDLQVIQARIAGSRERITAIDARRTEIIEELEFYSAGRGRASGKRREQPPELTAEQDRLREEKARLVASIERDEATIAEIRQRNARDRKRWLELTQGGKVLPDGRSPRS